MATGTRGDTLTYSMNRVAGTIVNRIPTLDACGAANVWAGTSGMSLVGALNTEAGITDRKQYLDLAGVLNLLAGTTGLDAAGAASQIDA